MASTVEDRLSYLLEAVSSLTALGAFLETLVSFIGSSNDCSMYRYV